MERRAARSPKILSNFGDYELLEEIGRGGQGIVYRAHQKSLNRTVALKVIGLGPWTTEAHLKRFRWEAEAAASLEHPCIVPIHEVGERDGQCYFSMKLVEGGQLDEVVRREPMPIRQSAELIAKVARTVHYAHEHGILHRDIKPGNILLDKNGEPHLTDFGLARLVEAESTVTGTLEVLGTPSYMAPEQAVGNKAQLTSATDVYGLGAVLYQLLTEHPPFAGGTTYETIKLAAGERAAAAAVVESKNRSRPFNNLSQVPGERSKAPVFFRSGTCRRPRTLAKARADSGTPHRNFHSSTQMGASKSSYYCLDWIIGCFGSSDELECLEERANQPALNKEHRSAAV